VRTTVTVRAGAPNSSITFSPTKSPGSGTRLIFAGAISSSSPGTETTRRPVGAPRRLIAIPVSVGTAFMTSQCFVSFTNFRSMSG
jgi:hypothetical protein